MADRTGSENVAGSERWFPVRVECYAGHRGEETPRRFWLGRRCVDVTEVADRWLAPDHRYFKLHSDDGEYLLRHDSLVGTWELIMYTAGRDDNQEQRP